VIGGSGDLMHLIIEYTEARNKKGQLTKAGLFVCVPSMFDSSKVKVLLTT
jgi:hypothetical protein